MNDRKDPKKPEKGRVSGREMADALADVLKEESEKARDRRETDEKKKKDRRGTGPGAWLAFGVFAVLAGYVWVGSPAWLDSSPPPVPPPLLEAGMRMEIFQSALVVEEFLENRGRLPDDLGEAGEPDAEVQYEALDRETYRLSLAGPQGSLEHVSSDSLELFLGDAVQVIQTGG